MDYTTLANVKAVLGADAVGDDALISRIITEASRAIDRHVAGGMLKSDNYFLLETITDELLNGQVDAQGRILCRAHKPLVASVSTAAFRYAPSMSWVTVLTDNITIDGYSVTLWAGQVVRRKVQVKLTYSGGLATSTIGLPGDITNAADLLSTRFYREIKSNLTDSIGVAELGTLQYTKAFPTRLIEMLKPYKRVIA